MMLPALANRALLSGHLRRSFKSIRLVSNSGCSRPPPELKVGDVIHGFKLHQMDHIKELNIRPYYLKHESTGAEHLHIHKDGDTNNVFYVGLRTTPQDDTGVAHVLEHITLCGSQKYNIRDPFFKMITRSLATFLNAMTGPDYTCYPISSQNEKDFENLLRVFADCVYFPKLRPVDFRQEGWRLEHDKPDKKDTPIVIKGVVYNEMKGTLSSSSNLYVLNLMGNLLPDTTYRYESGGRPEAITKLTHEEMKKFYQVHYHPSNSKFYTYGNFPLENNLKLINELVLSHFNENPQARELSVVKEQEFWSEPRTVDMYCAFDPLSADPEKQTTTSVSYLLPTVITNFEEMFSIQILCSLLVDGPNAPFYKSLIESGLGSDYSPSTGLCNETKQPYFSVGLQNIHPNDVAKVHEKIEMAFQETSRSGFSQERIDAILHDIELGLKHISGNFGLRLIYGLWSSWNHDGDPIESLKVNKYVEKFKASLASDSQYWTKLIEKYFLKNQHKLILNMHPDPAYDDKRKEQEQKLIEEKVSKLDETEKQTLVYEGIELMKIQSAPEDLSSLPCLEPSKDISRDLPCRANLKFDQHKGVNIQLCEQPTNEVVYFKALTTIDEKLRESDLVDYLSLFCDVATKLGAGKYNRQDFAQEIQLRTGGLGMSLMITPDLTEFDKFKIDVIFSSHCLPRNIRSMFELWQNLFKHIHFQENKDFLMQLVKGEAAELSDGVADEGHLYAIKRSSRGLSTISDFDEKLSGLTSVARIKDMAGSESVESITEKFLAIAQVVLDPFNMKCAINAEPEIMDQSVDELKRFIDSTQKCHSEQTNQHDPTRFSKEDRPNATKVDDMKLPFANHYVAKSLISVPRSHPDHAKLVILAKLISSKYLHREVREKGGAYGSGLRVSNSGIMSFYSYRDPNTDETMDIYNKAAAWVEDGSGYTDEDIEESKLGVFQGVDKPVPPGKRGMSYFTLGESDDMREEYRRRLLDVTRADVKEVAAKYLNSEKFGVHII